MPTPSSAIARRRRCSSNSTARRAPLPSRPSWRRRSPPSTAAAAFDWATAPEDRSRLWHARDNTLYAGSACGPAQRAVITDVCVPISRLAECLTETRAIADEHGFTAPIVGHVGDGNFHMLILIDPAKPEEIDGAKALQARMVARAIAMDGTCTGEHGIGLGKIDYLDRRARRSRRCDAIDQDRARSGRLDEPRQDLCGSAAMSETVEAPPAARSCAASARNFPASRRWTTCPSRSTRAKSTCCSARTARASRA